MDRGSSRRIRQIRRGLLYLEALAVVLLLPAAARFSGDLLRRVAGVVLSPRFVFLLGNAIVLLLLRSSGHLISSSSSSGDVISDLLDHHSPPPPVVEIEEEVEGGKEVEIEGEGENVDVEEEEVLEEGSAELQREEEESVELRREEEESAELRREDVGGDGDDVEFRRTVEAFIERQLRFRRQESMEIVFSATDTLEIFVPVAV